MGILSNSPQGFSSAVESLNTLPQGLLAELVSKLELVGVSSWPLLNLVVWRCDGLPAV